MLPALLYVQKKNNIERYTLLFFVHNKIDLE